MAAVPIQPPTCPRSLSSSFQRRDYEEKHREYRKAGVGEYWIVDRFARQMTVHRNTALGPSELAVAEGETDQTPLLPGFELPLARLLAVADRWV